MLKVGFVLFCLTGLAVAAVIVWTETRVLIPIDAAWPRGTDHWRTSEFTPNVSTGYFVDVWYKVRLPQAAKDCLDRWSFARDRPADCGEPLPGVPKVTVVRVRSGMSSPLSGGNFDERRYVVAKNEYTHTVGGFRAQAGQSYQLDIDEKISPETVAQLQPHIRVSINPLWLKTVGAWSGIFVLACLVPFFVSLALIIGGLTRRSK